MITSWQFLAVYSTWRKYSDRDSDTIPFLHAEELIELVDFHPDILSGLQRHDNELAVFSRIQYLAKVFRSEQRHHSLPPRGRIDRACGLPSRYPLRASAP